MFPWLMTTVFKPLECFPQWQQLLMTMTVMGSQHPSQQARNREQFGPTLEDSDDDGKPAAKPAAKKCRALHSSDSALVPVERPLKSGSLVPEGPVPPVAAMPPEAA